MFYPELLLTEKALGQLKSVRTGLCITRDRKHERAFVVGVVTRYAPTVIKKTRLSKEICNKE